MKEYQLTPHPDSLSGPARSITASIGRISDREVAFGFEVSGQLSQISWPKRGELQRTDELWKHTCFEAFIRLPHGAGYLELNFSPSGNWAAYIFDRYRGDLKNADVALHGNQDFGSEAAKGKWWAALPELAGAKLLELNLTAVIEATDGTKSYWALAHAPGPPDFHNPDCFIATLPAPGRA